FGVVDTNSDPRKLDFVIPGNDDATKSISILTNYVTAAIAEGLQERVKDKEQEAEEEEEDDREKEISRFEKGDDDEEEEAKKLRRRKGTPAKKKTATSGRNTKK